VITTSVVRGGILRYQPNDQAGPRRAGLHPQTAELLDMLVARFEDSLLACEDQIGGLEDSLHAAQTQVQAVHDELITT
jgi:hypothetical protein